VAHLSHHEWSLPVRGELVHSFTVEDASEHAVAHLERLLANEMLVVVPQSLVVLGDAVLRTTERRLRSSRSVGL
jgi:hypothetical protein